MRLSPGCNCCSCTIFEDDFTRDYSTDLGPNWVELAQDWYIGTNALVVESAAAAVQCTTAHTSSDMAVVVDITCPDSGDQARVCLRMEDEDNYLFAEITFSGASGTLEIYERTGGVDGIALDSTTVTITAGSTYTVTACVKDNTLLAVVADSTGKRLDGVSGPVSTSTQRKAGLATGGTLTASCTFDDFLFLQRRDSCETCYACPVLPFSDDFATADPNWTLGTGTSITGGELVTGPGGDAKAVQCAQTPTGTGWTVTFQATAATIPPLANGMPFGWLTAATAALFTLTPNGFAGNYPWKAGASSGNISVTPIDGDIVKVVVTENAGNYDVEFYINGTLEHSVAGVSATLGATFNFGWSAGGIVNGFHWDDVSVVQT